MTKSTPSLSGVFPIVATPFRADGVADLDDLRAVVEFIIRAGADGVVFPGVASEFDQLTLEEREGLTAVVIDQVAGRKPVVVGVSAATAEASLRLARHAARAGATALMLMAPPALPDLAALKGFFGHVASAATLPIILQNQPKPIGAGLPIDQVVEIVRDTPLICWVKEETMPCGQRISQLIASRPSNLIGVFGGAGGRYLPDELARGALGTMPACELTDLHVALFACHCNAEVAGVRMWFDRMLPLLNFQAVFRMRMTKEVLHRRGVIVHTYARAPGPELDRGDQFELDAILANLSPYLKEVSSATAPDPIFQSLRQQHGPT
jgi:4-hydroxy-tetrahydrodipicolinate synthase